MSKKQRRAQRGGQHRQPGSAPAAREGTARPTRVTGGAVGSSSAPGAKSAGAAAGATGTGGRAPGLDRTSAPAVALRPGSAAARREATLKYRRRRRLATPIALGIGALLAVGLLLAFAGFGRPDLGRGVASEGGVNQHIPAGQSITYRNRPPSSGPHRVETAPLGLSVTPLDPTNWVHNLEHGNIVVLYKCKDTAECTTIGNSLKTEIYDKANPGGFSVPQIVITPYQDMDHAVTAVAWTRVLEFDTADPAQIAAPILAFHDRYLNQGPERQRV
jgi:hypothetical protein